MGVPVEGGLIGDVAGFSSGGRRGIWGGGEAPSGSAHRITGDLEKEHWSLPGADGWRASLLMNALGRALLWIIETIAIVGIMHDKQEQRIWPWKNRKGMDAWVCEPKINS